MSGWIREIKHFIYKAKKSQDKIPVHLNPKEEPWFAVAWEREDDPYLTFDQLNKLRSLTFESSIGNERKLEYVRDYFLLGANCGASYIDFKNIKTLFQENDKWYCSYIRIKTFKKKVQKMRIKIPIRQQYVIDLYHKYSEINKGKGLEPGFNFTTNDKVFNERIIELCERAGFTEAIERWTQNPLTGEPVKVMVKNEKGELVIPRLNQTITSKCMRKTFASNEVREHYQHLSVVKQWTQHSSEAAVLEYIMLSESDYFAMSNRRANEIEELKKEIRELKSKIF